MKDTLGTTCANSADLFFVERFSSLRGSNVLYRNYTGTLSCVLCREDYYAVSIFERVHYQRFVLCREVFLFESFKMYCRNYTGSFCCVLCREDYYAVSIFDRVHYQRSHHSSDSELVPVLPALGSTYYPSSTAYTF